MTSTRQGVVVTAQKQQFSPQNSARFNLLVSPPQSWLQSVVSTPTDRSTPHSPLPPGWTAQHGTERESGRSDHCPCWACFTSSQWPSKERRPGGWPSIPLTSGRQLGRQVMAWRAFLPCSQSFWEELRAYASMSTYCWKVYLEKIDYLALLNQTLALWSMRLSWLTTQWEKKKTQTNKKRHMSSWCYIADALPPGLQVARTQLTQASHNIHLVLLGYWPEASGYQRQKGPLHSLWILPGQRVGTVFAYNSYYVKQ